MSTSVLLREIGGCGALQLVFDDVAGQVNSNRISVEDSQFIGNSAGWGGAVGLFTSHTLNSSLLFTNCTFLETRHQLEQPYI